MSRYRPTTEAEIRQGIDNRPEPKLSGRLIGYLIHFIYEQIAYQRKESIRTMVGFCRESDQSSEAVQRRMKAFFDRNPKFSDRLEYMASQAVSIESVMDIIGLVEGYDDAEHLFWETRRLLDERFRADWAAINIYSLIYREKSVSSNTLITFNQMTTELDQRLAINRRSEFLISFFNGICAFDRTLRDEISKRLLPQLFEQLYLRQKLDCLPILEGISCRPDTRGHIQAMISDHQINGFLNVVKHKHGLG